MVQHTPTRTVVEGRKERKGRKKKKGRGRVKRKKKINVEKKLRSNESKIFTVTEEQS